MEKVIYLAQTIILKLAFEYHEESVTCSKNIL